MQRRVPTHHSKMLRHLICFSSVLVLREAQRKKSAETDHIKSAETDHHSVQLKQLLLSPQINNTLLKKLMQIE